MNFRMVTRKVVTRELVTEDTNVTPPAQKTLVVVVVVGGEVNAGACALKGERVYWREREGFAKLTWSTLGETARWQTLEKFETRSWMGSTRMVTSPDH